MLCLGLPTCAAAILPRGQEKAEGRIGNTVKAFDEPTRQNHPALRVAPRRAPAVSPRLHDVPASRGARLLADRLAATQRRLGSPKHNRL
jgi:hypothetical protein